MSKDISHVPTFGIDQKTASDYYSNNDDLTTSRTKLTEESSIITTPIDIPVSIQSIITQTDASGNQIRHEATTSWPSSTRSDSSNVLKTSSLNRLLCACFSRSKPAIPMRDIRQIGIRTSPGSRSGQRQNSKSSFRNSFQSINHPLPQIIPDLGETLPHNMGKKLLALDLDETLVHSSFQPVPNADYIIPVEIDGIVHKVYVLKRPGVDEFLKRMSEYYELVVYTASLSKYADPLLDELDKDRLITNRLFRENCVFYNGHYVKDLSLFINHDLSDAIIIDNSPMSYIFQPHNAIDCSSFIDSLSDIELWQIADFLVAISGCDDVRKYCRRWREWCALNPSIIPGR